MAAAGRKGCGGGRDEEEGGGGGGGGPGASSPSPSPSSSSSSSSSSLWRPCRARLPFLSFLFLFLFFLLLAVVPASSSGSRRGGRAVKALSDGEWRELLAGEWMVAFYAPWCPACQNLQPEWESFAEWEEDLEINIAKVDVTEQPGLSGRFIITALPTIYHLASPCLNCSAVVMSAALQGALSAPALEAFKAKLDNPPDSCKDGEFRRYQGPRTKNDFISFISDQEWRSIEPVSSWFVPSSFLMSSMSALFQLSMWIRHCHNYFTESLGIPPWGSYAIFALATLFSGLLLGLVMVFLADCICPSKKRRPMQRPSQKNRPEAAEPVRKRGGADGGDLSDADLGPSEPVCADPTSNAVRQRVVAPGAEVAAAS